MPSYNGSYLPIRDAVFQLATDAWQFTGDLFEMPPILLRTMDDLGQEGKLEVEEQDSGRRFRLPQ